MSSSSSSKPFNNVEEVVQSLQQFGWLDYSIVVVMLVNCSLIGLYYGVQSKKKQEQSKSRRGSVALDYIVGGRALSIYPVSMSLIATWISGISFLGLATETYLYGTGFMFYNLSMVLCGILINYLFLPVFMELKLTSTYEYLETRFDKRVRLFGAVLFTIGALFKLPIMIYVPALAFNQVAGVNIHIVTTIMCTICIFYTSIGGVKAVIWTDTLQIIIIYGSLFSIIGYGILNAGGLGTVLERNMNSGRIETPPMSFDLTERHTMLGILIGGAAFNIQQNSINQCVMQRFLSLPSLKSARKALWVYILGVAIVSFSSSFNGLLVYAKYFDCDPLTTKLAKAKDQLLPLFVMDIFQNIPGLPGLFIAGIFSATLSSLSTSLNSLTSIFYEDFVKPFTKQPLSEPTVNNILRIVVIVYGIIAVALVLVVEQLGTVLQLAMSVVTVTNGPLLSIFIIGLMIPWINGKSAFIGGCSGLIVMSWMSGKAQLMAASGEITFPVKSLTVDGCAYNFSISNNNQTMHPLTQEKSLYHLSYIWYVILGTSVCLSVACLSSFVFGWNKPDEVDQNVLAPFVRKYFKTGSKSCNSITASEVGEHKSVTHKLISENELR